MSRFEKTDDDTYAERRSGIPSAMRPGRRTVPAAELVTGSGGLAERSAGGGIIPLTESMKDDPLFKLGWVPLVLTTTTRKWAKSISGRVVFVEATIAEVVSARSSGVEGLFEVVLPKMAKEEGTTVDELKRRMREDS